MPNNDKNKSTVRDNAKNTVDSEEKRAGDVYNKVLNKVNEKVSEERKK